jgi:hypothetical protein
MMESPLQDEGNQDNAAGEEEYEEIFARFSNSVERRLVRLAQVLAVLLLVVQLALLIPGVRHTIIRVERLEGNPFTSRP